MWYAHCVLCPNMAVADEQKTIDSGNRLIPHLPKDWRKFVFFEESLSPSAHTATFVVCPVCLSRYQSGVVPIRFGKAGLMRALASTLADKTESDPCPEPA